MEMTLETLTGLEPGSYTLVDLRSAHDIGYGKIPGALEIPAGELKKSCPETANRWSCTAPGGGSAKSQRKICGTPGSMRTA